MAYYHLIGLLAFRIKEYKIVCDDVKFKSYRYKYLLEVRKAFTEYADENFHSLTHTLNNDATLPKFIDLCEIMIDLERQRYGTHWDKYKSPYWWYYNYAKGFTTCDFNKYWDEYEIFKYKDYTKCNIF